MNKEKRQFVHEYCAHFGCESEAYDAEPKRNVVAIAVKGRVNREISNLKNFSKVHRLIEIFLYLVLVTCLFGFGSLATRKWPT